MKKIRNLILTGLATVIMALLLVACGENPASNPAAAQPTAGNVTAPATTAPAATGAPASATPADEGTALALDEPVPAEVAKNSQVPGQVELVVRQPAQSDRQPLQRSQNGGDVVYIVVRGDTLSGIAWYYGTTVKAIVDANSLTNSNLIYAGQRLVIPATKNPDPQPVIYYVVQPGDTTYSLARRFGTTVEAIVKANGLSDPNKLQAGQRLAIPGASNPGNPSQVYIVQRGDSLSSIAAYFGTSVSKLAKDNHIANPNRIYVGQRLVVRA